MQKNKDLGWMLGESFLVCPSQKGGKRLSSPCLGSCTATGRLSTPAVPYPCWQFPCGRLTSLIRKANEQRLECQELRVSHGLGWQRYSHFCFLSHCCITQQLKHQHQHVDATISMPKQAPIPQYSHGFWLLWVLKRRVRVQNMLGGELGKAGSTTQRTHPRTCPSTSNYA